MMWGDHTHVSAWLWPMLALLVLLGAGFVAWIVVVARRGKDEGADSVTGILEQRFAQGEIDESEYRARLATLGAKSRGRQWRSGAWRSAPVLVGAVVVVLVAAMTAAAAVATRSSSIPYSRLFVPSANGPTCRVPSLPGRAVDVTLDDMGSMMGGRGMMGGSYPGSMMGGSYYRGSMMGPGRMGIMGIMRIIASPSAVPAGQVSLRVWNSGSIVHELVVLPLPSGGIGTRPVGSDGRVSERGSLGEASATCGPGAGDGIAPGTSGWVTLTLSPGRYELVCNLPGHYAAGMFAELDVR